MSLRHPCDTLSGTPFDVSDPVASGILPEIPLFIRGDRPLSLRFGGEGAVNRFRKGGKPNAISRIRRVNAIREHRRCRPLRLRVCEPVGDVEPNDLFAVSERLEYLIRPIIACASFCMTLVIDAASAREDCREDDLRLRLALADTGEDGLHPKRRLPGICGVSR